MKARVWGWVTFQAGSTHAHGEVPPPPPWGQSLALGPSQTSSCVSLRPAVPLYQPVSTRRHLPELCERL